MTTKAELLAQVMEAMRQEEVLQAQLLTQLDQVERMLANLDKYSDRLSAITDILRALPVGDNFDLDNLPDGVDLTGDEWKHDQGTNE